MRVIHLIPTLKKGGAERFALDVAIAQGRLLGRDNVLLLVMDAFNEYEDYSHLANVHFIDSRYLPSLTGRSIEAVDGYRRLVTSVKPDVIHTHLFGAELLSAAWIHDQALYVTHCHDAMAEFRRFTLRGLSKRTFTDYYERSLLMWKKYRRVRPYFVANSEDTYAYFRRMLPKRLAQRVEHIPYGFHFQRFFDPARSPRTHPADPPVLTMVGSFLWPKKNQELLVDVGAELARRGRSFVLNFVGDGPRRPSIEAYAVARGVRDRCQFWGLVTNVEDVLWKSDVYVHSATYEPFGLVFLEAMAAGLPCVALDGKGNRGLIRDGTHGYLLDVADPAAFAERIIETVGDSGRYAAMSKSAIARAADFDIGVCAQTLLDFYAAKRDLDPDESRSAGPDHRG
jgi:glycosyltransferase involved in cell wall biosynthesis